MITIGKNADYMLLQKLASITKIPRSEFKPEYLENEHGQLPIYSYPILTEARSGFDPLFYGVSITGGQHQLTLTELFDPKKWLKSEVRQAYKEGIEYLSKPVCRDRYVLATYVVGMVWITNYCNSPIDFFSNRGSFNGGILVRDIEMGGYFMTRPIKSFVGEFIDLQEDAT